MAVNWLAGYKTQPTSILNSGGMSPEEYYNAPAQTGNALSGFGTSTPFTLTADQLKPIGVGASRFNPSVQSQLTGMGINELPGWLQNFSGGHFDQTDLAPALQTALGVDPAAWLAGGGKTQQAMHNAGIYDFRNGMGYGMLGAEIPWDDTTKAAVQQAYLSRRLKPNTGGFGLSEALGLGSVLLPIAAAMSIPALIGGGAAAAASGAGAGAAAPATVGGVGGVGAGVGGAGAASGFAGLSGPELVALTGGGSGVSAAGAGGGAGMGFLDTIGSLFSGGTGAATGGNVSIWPSLIQGGLGALGSYLGGQQVQEGVDKGTDAIQAMYGQNRADMLPLLQLLGQYAPQFAQVASSGGVDYTNDPIYQADKAEMMRTLKHGQSSIGKLRSSDTDNAITRNLSTLMNSAFARKYGGLLDLLKLGSGAGSTAGAYGQNTANALAGLYNAGGNAQANMIGGMFGSGMGALNNWQLLNLLSSMRRQ